MSAFRNATRYFLALSLFIVCHLLRAGGGWLILRLETRLMVIGWGMLILGTELMVVGYSLVRTLPLEFVYRAAVFISLSVMAAMPLLEGLSTLFASLEIDSYVITNVAIGLGIIVINLGNFIYFYHRYGLHRKMNGKTGGPKVEFQSPAT